jgi:outer membrane biosynthesis protein TonB
MLRRIMFLPLFLIAGICCTPIFAQDQDKVALERLLAGRAQYYTPTASGLKSFHCEATIDWKGMLTRFRRTEIPDNDPVLKYLQTVHLSVADQLNGKGSMAMDWAETGVPPGGQEDSLKQMRNGLQARMADFFQGWNAYMNGSMVPIPKSWVTVTLMGAGVHLSGTSAGTSIDEDFDQNMLLTQVRVVSPEMRLLAIPRYVETADGLVISAVTYKSNKPPSAPLTEVTLRIKYAKVDSFQIPSNVVLDTKNVGVIEVGFNACQVSVADAAPKPNSEKSGVSTLSNNPSPSQIDSIKQTPPSENQIPVSRASCGYQATQVLVFGTPGPSSPIGTVKCDEGVTIIYDEVGYYKVQVANGTQGYILRLFVTNPIQEASVGDGSHEGIVRVGASGIAPPTCIHCPDPKFTPEARKAKYQGNIELEVIITREGKVMYVRAVQVTTLDKQVVSTAALDRAWVSLEETAIDSVKQWLFKPAHATDGTPVAIVVPMEVTFRLR